MKKQKTELLHRTFKCKVDLSDEAKSIFEQVSITMVILWNMAHDQIVQWMSENKDKPKDERKAVNTFALNYWLTPVRASNREIDRVSSDICQQVLKILMGGFESFWALKKNNDPKARWPKKKGSEEKPFQGFLTIAWQTAKLSRDGTQILLPSLDKKRVVIELPKYLRESIQNKLVKYVKMYKNQKGEFWLSLVCVSKLPQLRTEGIVRAVDFGAGHVAVSDSDGSEFLIVTRREDKWVRQQVRSIENRTRLRKKGSRGYKKLMDARRGIFARSENQHVDHQRKIAHAICEEKVRCLVIGKPKTRIGLAQSDSGDQNWGVQNTGYMGRLMLFIKEKAKERGIEVIEVSDPKRSGDIDDPESKFNATREMLGVGCSEKSGTSVPSKFTRKGFRI